jgi:hypothetical protein
MPGASQRELDAVPTDGGEQPGMGKALGAVVGGAVGAAGGLPIGAAVISVLVPGIGPVIAVGLIGAALLGMGGAAIGGSIENAVSEGLPKDEMFVYEDALRQGRTVLIALTRDESRAEEAREALRAAGALSIDAAREQWWIGLRVIEVGAYAAHEEETYRLGFEAALHRDASGRSLDEAMPSLKNRYPDVVGSPAFGRGYERGQAYQQRLGEQPARGELKKSA